MSLLEKMKQRSDLQHVPSGDAHVAARQEEAKKLHRQPPRAGMKRERRRR